MAARRPPEGSPKTKLLIPKSTIMKTILTFSAAVLSLLVFTASADAAPRKGVHRNVHRAPVHSHHSHHVHERVVYRKVMVGRAADGCPIYRTIAVRVHDHGRGHVHGHYGHGHR